MALAIIVFASLLSSSDSSAATGFGESIGLSCRLAGSGTLGLADTGIGIPDCSMNSGVVP